MPFASVLFATGQKSGGNGGGGGSGGNPTEAAAAGDAEEKDDTNTMDGQGNDNALVKNDVRTPANKNPLPGEPGFIGPLNRPADEIVAERRAKEEQSADTSRPGVPVGVDGTLIIVLPNEQQWKATMRDVEAPRPGAFRALLVGAETGMMEVGRVLTSPLRFTELIDWKARDEDIRRHWEYIGLEGTGSQVATKAIASVSGKAAQAAFIIIAIEAAVPALASGSGVVLSRLPGGAAVMSGASAAAPTILNGLKWSQLPVGTVVGYVSFQEGKAAYYYAQSGDTDAAIEHGSNSVIGGLFTGDLAQGGVRTIIVAIAEARELAVVRQQIASQLEEIARRRALGVSDAGYSAAEEAGAVELERVLGKKLVRDPSNAADWLANGKSYDHWGVPSKVFDKELKNGNLLASLRRHVDGVKTDFAVVDTIGLTDAQLAQLKALIDTLSPTERARIIDLRGNLGI